MNEMDWVTCEIALGGDIRNTVFRSRFDPISVPELDILAVIHGDVAVQRVEFCKTTESSPAQEKARLLSKYSEPLVHGVYPGRNPNGMQMVMANRPQKGFNAVEDVDVPPEVPKHDTPPARTHEQVHAKPAPRGKPSTTLAKAAAKGVSAAAPFIPPDLSDSIAAPETEAAE